MICSKCKIDKSQEDFEFRKDRQKYRNKCRQCSNLDSKLRRKYNPENEKKRYHATYDKYKDRKKRRRLIYNNENADKLFEYSLKRKYNITKDFFDLMFNDQQGKCAICKNPETALHKQSGKVRRLHVDHDHKTGKVRGLLCTRCNMALGYLKENKEYVLNLLKYIEVNC